MHTERGELFSAFPEPHGLYGDAHRWVVAELFRCHSQRVPWADGRAGARLQCGDGVQQSRGGQQGQHVEGGMRAGLLCCSIGR